MPSSAAPSFAPSRGVEAAETKHSGRSVAAFDPLSTLPADVPARWAAYWRKLAARADRSYAAAVELACLSCVAWDRREAKRCHITGCPLWAVSSRIFGRSPARDTVPDASTNAPEGAQKESTCPARSTT